MFHSLCLASTRMVEETYGRRDVWMLLPRTWRGLRRTLWGIVLYVNSGSYHGYCIRRSTFMDLGTNISHDKVIRFVSDVAIISCIRAFKVNFRYGKPLKVQ